MQKSIMGTAGHFAPPRTWGAEPDAFIRALRSPWYGLVADLEDLVLRATVEYAHSRGLRAMYLPMTTRTITCPTGLGSDSEPVPVTVSGVDTYLPDSMQFLLEYGCRLAPGGCYNVLPSFRGEQPDRTHLGQYVHSEAEIPGGLDDLIEYVEGYVRHLAGSMLDQYGARLAERAGDVAHLERMAGHSGGFERLTFDEAAHLLRNDEGTIRDEGDWRTLTKRGEHLLMERVSEFVWVTHFDHLSNPFYQAFSDSSQRSANNADLLFGMGEVVGSGERHIGSGDVRKALAMHDVPERDYAWYVNMKDEFPMHTSGFGMGVERFLMWVLKHDDIRDIPLISRVAEEKSWPDSVDRP
ncbi:amino acid--tRNA ligase-related protein [Streptomyces formicae]|uniref:Asparaginyl-tRNA synthetase n=1 Tax=Streptomyces formicae TaxID=1616117 RepID=A0A291QHJ7_9ACTN|nr:amino acid--tRNA ligase-related protein [Streptomyces formicae]ATL31028.1 Asparaginyl-tRNA synthetase [Streptomyces formicae]